MVPGLSQVTATAVSIGSQIRLVWSTSTILCPVRAVVQVITPWLKATALSLSRRSRLLATINTNLNTAVKSAPLVARGYLSAALIDLQALTGGTAKPVALALITQTKAHVSSAQTVSGLSGQLKQLLKTIQNQLQTLAGTY